MDPESQPQNTNENPAAAPVAAPSVAASVVPSAPPAPNTQPPENGIVMDAATAANAAANANPNPNAAANANPADVMAMSVVCASCGSIVPKYYTFCPHCGKPIGDKGLSTTLMSQIWIYGMSVFLPPLGMWPGIKYFKSSDPKAQKMGTIAIVLTIASTIITLWLTFYFVQVYIGQINSALNGTGITPSEATGGLF